MKNTVASIGLSKEICVFEIVCEVLVSINSKVLDVSDQMAKKNTAKIFQNAEGRKVPRGTKWPIRARPADHFYPTTFALMGSVRCI